MNKKQKLFVRIVALVCAALIAGSILLVAIYAGR